jgi:hypothetical protein
MRAYDITAETIRHRVVRLRLLWRSMRWSAWKDVNLFHDIPNVDVAITPATHGLVPLGDSAGGVAPPC